MNQTIIQLPFQLKERNQEIVNQIRDVSKKTPCGKAFYYPYNCEQNVDDYGWGCAWRAIQLVLSSYGQISEFKFLFLEFGQHNKLIELYQQMKGLESIPEWLFTSNFAPHSQDNGWAEPFIGQLIFYNFKIRSRLYCVNGIPFCNAPKEVFEEIMTFQQYSDTLIAHFQNKGHPVMIDDGIIARTILNYERGENQNFIMHIADPHVKKQSNENENGRMIFLTEQESEYENYHNTRVFRCNDLDKLNLMVCQPIDL